MEKMTELCRKSGKGKEALEGMNDTPYYDARVRAAEKDPAFESRQGAGAVIGIGSTRLYQIERGIRLPHEDEIIVMAKEYNAPELIEYYCKHVCAISAYCHKDK